ncbi:MAG: GNAT family N-acetyltransferase [bacterium]|nr:GNAT family N-acetyltransferase [bacterium]
MVIRKASSKDMPAILKLIGEYPGQLMQSHLPKASEFLVAIESQHIVGCCALAIYSTRLAEIRSLAVNKKFQGRGIGTQLIKSCLKAAKKKRVYEVISLTSAPDLFKKHGFGAFNKAKYALIKILNR